MDNQLVVDIVKEKNSTYREDYDSHVSVQLLKECRVNEDNDFTVGIVSTDFTEAFFVYVRCVFWTLSNI